MTRAYKSPKSHTENLRQSDGHRQVQDYGPHVSEAEAIARALLPAPRMTPEEFKARQMARVTIRKFSFEEKKP